MSVVKQCDKCKRIVKHLYRYLRKEKINGKWESDAIDFCDDCYKEFKEWSKPTTHR